MERRGLCTDYIRREVHGGNRGKAGCRKSPEDAGISVHGWETGSDRNNAERAGR